MYDPHERTLYPGLAAQTRGFYHKVVVGPPRLSSYDASTSSWCLSTIYIVILIIASINVVLSIRIS